MPSQCLPARVQQDPLTGALLLSLSPGRYRSRPLVLAEGRFLPTPDCHVTLLGRRLAGRLSAEQKRQLLQLAQTHLWQVRPCAECLLLERPAEHIQQPPAQSIIELVAVPAAFAFYQQLRELHRSDWPLPPMHVTAMTATGERGIGLYSAAELDRWRQRPLTTEERRQLILDDNPD